MGKVYGERPRPWAFVIGVDEASGFADDIREILPTVRFVDGTGLVRQRDYDVAIIVKRNINVDPHLHVIRFGGPTHVTRAVAVGGLKTNLPLRVHIGSFAERFVVGDAAEQEGLVALSEASLLPPPASDYDVLGSPDHTVHAFARELDGEALAGWVHRFDGKPAELWWLPPRALARGADWVRAALARWAREFPDIFTTGTPWTQDSQWMTRAEREAERVLLTHRARVATEVERLNDETLRLDAELAAARAEADDGDRRLLTAQNADLVNAVVAALRELGFETVDSDDLPQHKSGKQEDLRIIDGTWMALAEVKGYSRRNAKEGDLLQLGKAVEAFILSERRAPDARWYIVNQNFAAPPSQRARPLVGSTAIEAFATSGGLVIDTRDLFMLREAVRDHVYSSDEARRLLRVATGVFNLASED